MRTFLIAGVLALVLGVAGLIRAAVPLPATAAVSDPIVVTNAWVAAPAPPTKAAAGYFTATNNTDKPQLLLSVVTSAGSSNVIHEDVNGAMVAQPDGVTIPAHGKLVLSVGQGHVMITGLFGDLEAGQVVSMQLTFADLTPVSFTAKVYAPGDRP